MTASSTHLLPTERGRRAAGEWLAWAVALLLIGGAAEARSPRRVDEKQAAARAKFVAGTKAYNLGQFEVALKEYEEAYSLVPQVGFLFNLAQCHRHLEHYEQAIFNYRRYLTEGRVSPENAAVVEGLIAEMEENQAEQNRQRRAEAEAARERELELARAAALRAELEVANNRGADAAVKGLSDRSPTAPPPSENILKKWWLWAGLGAVATGVVVYAAVPAHPRNATLGSINAR